MSAKSDAKDALAKEVPVLTFNVQLKIFAGQKFRLTLLPLIALQKGTNFCPSCKDCDMFYVIITTRQKLRMKKISPMRAMGKKTKIFPTQNFPAIQY